MHEKHKAILLEILCYFGVGKIYKHGSKTLQLCVDNLKELEIIINHFNKYPLFTKKCNDFKLFIMVHDIMRRKEHLTKEGFMKILAIKASMNHGLSEKLKVAFPDILAVERPLVIEKKIPDPN